MADVDLERLADGYHHRPTGEAGRGRAAFAAGAARLGGGHLALDIGGGRGGHALVFAARGARAVVVDPAAGMVGAALASGLIAVRARGEALPFPTDSVRLAYFHLVVHHGDWRAMVREAILVVAPGGAVFVWTFTDDHHGRSHLARWFPSVVEIDEERFPPPAEIAGGLRDLGLAQSSGTAVERKTIDAGSWAAAAEAGFVSTLQLLPTGELHTGLEAFRETHPDPAEVLSYELHYAWVCGIAPSLA